MERKAGEEGWMEHQNYGAPMNQLGGFLSRPSNMYADGSDPQRLNGEPRAIHATYLTYKAKQRWFVLEFDRLCWYRSAADTVRKGTILLSSVNRVVAPDSSYDGDREFFKENKAGFLVQSSDNWKNHEHQFVAETEDAMSLWVDLLEWGRKGYLSDPAAPPPSALSRQGTRPKEIMEESNFGGSLKRKTTGGWKDRYLVLTANKLVWYSSRRMNQEDKLGQINMRGIRGVYEGTNDAAPVDSDLPKTRLPCVFFIERAGDTTPLCFLAPTPMIAHQWVQTLLRVHVYLANNSDENLFTEEDIDNDDAQEDLLVSKARLDTLVSFVPRIVVKRFMADPSPLTDVEVDKINGAVLFADISGFTSLAESLAKKGAGEGAEILCQHLNAYFGKLVELIHQYGGDVIKYAGDALLAMWVGQPKFMAMMATQCALKIQTHTAKYSADNVTLTLHIGIGAGAIFGLHLGGVNDRWEYLIGGDPMLQIAGAEAAAKSGEVVLHKEAYEKIKEHIVARLVPGTTDLYKLEDIKNQMPPPAPINIDPPLSLQPVLRCYIPVVVRKRIDFGLAQWMAELRRVTVLFGHLPDLKDFTGKKEQTEKLQAAFRTMQTIVFNYDGTVRQFIIDDKGSVLVAAFYVHEDDPVRAIKAALKMNAKLKEINIKCSVGVTTGKVFLGAVGSEMRREFAMVGDTVNLSARLMVAAQGTVLCDNYSFQAAQLHPQSGLVFKTLEPIMVKGKKNPIPIFSPFFQTSRNVGSNIHRSTAHQSAGHDLIGREREKTLLLSAIEQLKKEEIKKTIVLEGEEGIGKTQIMHFLRQTVLTMAQEEKEIKDKPLLFEVPGDSIHSFSQLYSWQSCIIALLLNFDHDDDEDDLGFEESQHALQEHVEDLLDRLPPPHVAHGEAPAESWKAYGALLNDLLQIKFESTEKTAELDCGAKMQKTIDLIAAMLAYKAESRRIVVLIDDGHWLDAASWGVLVEMSKLIKSMLVVVSRRLTTSIPPDLNHLLQLTKGQTVKLSPFTLEDTGRVLCHVLNVQYVPETITRLIHEKSNGNPFFSENLAISLRDNKVIKIQNNTADLSSDIKNPSDISFPDTVEDVVTSRIGRLPSKSQFVLKVASVIGMQFELRMLMVVYPVNDEKDSLESCIQELEQLDFVTQVPYKSEATYRFSQAVVRECCYNLLLFQQRRTLHAAIAEWYKEYIEDHRPFYFRLGYHWEMAENFQKATFYYEKAGDESSRQYATHEAVTFFLKAIDMFPKAAKQANMDLNSPSYRLIQARMENSLAEAYYRLGDMDKSVHRVEAALKCLGLSMPNLSNVKSALMDAGRAIKQSLRMKKPNTGYSVDDQETMQGLRAYEVLANVYYILGDKTRMMNSCMRSVALAGDVAFKAELARVYAALCVASKMLGDNSDSQKNYARAVDLSTSVPHLATFARVLYMNALSNCMSGDLNGVNATLRSVLELYSRMAHWRKWCESANLMSQERYLAGQFCESIEYGQQLMEQGAKHDDYQSMIWGLIAKAKGQIALGLLNDALDSLIESERLMTVDTAPAFVLSQEVEVMGLLALVHVRLGNMVEAARYTDVAMAKPELPESLYHMFVVFTDLAEVCFKLWLDPSTDLNKKDTNREHINRLCNIFSNMSKVYPVTAPRCLLRKGQMEWMFGITKKCRRSWEDAVYWASNIAGIPYERALVLFEVGTLSENEQEYEEFYGRAVDTFVNMGVPLPIGLLDGNKTDIQLGPRLNQPTTSVNRNSSVLSVPSRSALSSGSQPSSPSRPRGGEGSPGLSSLSLGSPRPSNLGRALSHGGDHH